MFETDPQFVVTALALITILSHGNDEVPEEPLSKEGAKTEVSLPDDIYYENW